MELKLSDVLEPLERGIESAVAAGFLSAQDILDKLTYRYSVWPDITAEVLRPHAETVLTRIWARQVEAEQAWPAVTDCDRMDAVFAQLESRAILCRQNFSINLSNALAEIRGEVRRAEGRGREVRGYVFFHEQDVGSALDGNLYLSFGCIEDEDDAARAIGHEVVRTLEENSLQVQWDGSLEERIIVRLDWKRRRSCPASETARPKDG